MTHLPTKIKRKELLSHKLIFVSGKGGTGKSLVAASLARLAAHEGLNVLLAESTGEARLPALLGKAAYGHSETKIGDHLWGINLTPSDCFREYVEDHLGLRQLYRRIFRHRIMKSFIEAIPGLNEVMILGRLCNTCKRHKNHRSFYDLIIVDAPASGHFLGLITTPDAVISSGLMGPLIREIEKIRDFLSDPQKATSLLVAQPEPLIMHETLEFQHLLRQQSPVKLTGILLNRSLQGEEHLLENLPVSDSSKIYQYLKFRLDEYDRQKKILLKALSNQESLPGYLCLPERGVIQSPLSQETIDKLWEDMAQ